MASASNIQPIPAGNTGASNVAGTQNALAVSLPGFNFNYDFGPSSGSIADSAYAYLSNSFATDQGFLNQSVAGSQAFLSHQITPLVNAAVATQNKVTGFLPTLFAMLNANAKSAQETSAALTQSAISSQTALAQSSINANAQIAANSGGGGGGGGPCFITTAVCDTLSLPDNNPILSTLRRFRDDVLDKSETGHAYVMLYYRLAPRLVEAIEKRADKVRVYATMLRVFLVPAVLSIDAGDYAGAFYYYRELVSFAMMCARNMRNKET
jgi:hypothetical protein